MKCPECQFENREGANFCNKCGAKLELVCPQCSAIITPDSEYCAACGSILRQTSEKKAPKDLSFDEKLTKIQKYLPEGLTEKILSQRDKIEGERKHVTVMFCDMVGFTQLSESIGPEEAYSVMDQVYEILIHIVHDHEGTVNEFTGDGIIALFGAPIAIEDGPQRAIRSAYAIHREMAHFSNKLKQEKENMPSIKMRIGINTGPVVVGTLGNDLRVEFKVVGDTVNLASRMEHIAEPGTTYVTKETFKLTEGLFQFEALGEKEIKGKKKPVFVYRLLSEKEKVYRPRLGFERMIYSEMVGRDKELDKLQLQVMKVINGEGSVVNIIGEAGIGKSRLIAELKSCDMIKKVALFEGRAIPIGRNLSFHIIGNLLKEWAQIGAADSGATALSKLETAVRQVDPEGLQEIFPFVATLMGMKLSGRYAERVKGIEGEALEKLILKNVRDLFVKAAGMIPLVLVAEDLHWADTSSIELMASLFPLVKTQQILFVNVFRPGYKETDEKIVEILSEKLPSHFVEIVLQPLDGRMSENLINNMLNIRGLQHTFINKIVERAGGNPFFLEEIVRSFIDEGAIVAKNGGFEVTEKIDSIIIPLTINDVLMARIDRLEEETRNLVKTASVIGRSFFYRILKEVARTIEDIDNRLSHLKEIELIRDRKRMDELEYLFKHALAQEAAYESILEQKRKGLHLKVADSIEKIFKERLDEFYGMLAFHYSKGEDLNKAEEYMIKAGEEALKSSASIEALRYYKEALNIYLKNYGDRADPAKIAMLEKNIAIALFNRGQFLESIEYIDKVLLYYGEKVPKNTIIFAFNLVNWFIIFLISLFFPFLKWNKTPAQNDIEVINLISKKTMGLTDLNPKMFLYEAFHAIRVITKFKYRLTEIVNGIGLFAGASAVFSWSGISFRLSQKVLEFVEEKINTKDPTTVIHYEFYKLLLNNLSGNWNAGKQFHKSLIDQNLRIGGVFYSTLYIFHYSNIQIEKGFLPESQELVHDLSEMGEMYENDYARMMSYIQKTKLLFKTRKLNYIHDEIEKGINFAKKMGVKAYNFYFYVFKTRTFIVTKNLKSAQKTLQLSEEILSEEKLVPYFLSIFYISKFSFLLHSLDETIKSGQKLKVGKYNKELKKTGSKMIKFASKVASELTEAFRLQGTHFWLLKDYNNAFKYWSKSIEEGERLGARLELSRSYFEVGKRLLQTKKYDKTFDKNRAEDCIEKARIMFKEMDLQWDQDELEKFSATLSEHIRSQ